ncbi:MAG: hypothetical protein V7675_00520 [Hyphomonas sp.]|uniref:hypothetical protein n=1 Tax=Hyphomonas sp. TaxID=87 RepID=UPI0030019B85
MTQLRLNWLLPAAALLLVACQAAPAAPASPEALAAPQTAVQVASADGADVVCRTMKVTGSRFAKRECKTPEVWAQYDAYTNQNAKESTDRMQRLNTGCSTQAQGGC